MQAKQSSTVLGIESKAAEVPAARELFPEEIREGARVTVVWIAAVEWSGCARHHGGRPVRLVKAEAGWIAW